MNHTVKKYPNRKLYLVLKSRYTTLSEIRSMVTSGDTIRVIKSGSEEDITKETLIQCLEHDKIDLEEIITLLKR